MDLRSYFYLEIRSKRSIAAYLQTLLRETDFVARYCREEFLAILSHTNTDGALTIAEKVKCSIAEQAFPMGHQVTVSIGVATAIAQDKNEEEAVRRADMALYHARTTAATRLDFAARLGIAASETNPTENAGFGMSEAKPERPPPLGRKRLGILRDRLDWSRGVVCSRFATVPTLSIAAGLDWRQPSSVRP